MSWITAALIAAILLAYLAIPNYARVFTPSLFGVTEVAPDVFTDAPEDRDALLALIDASKTRAAGFYGTLKSEPRFVLCTRPVCQKRFGFQSLGLAVGRRGVLVGPEGLNQTIIAHEISHIELRQYMRARDAINPRIPAWFDEGLASFVAQDKRLSQFTTSEATWIFDAHTFRDWSRMTHKDNWPDTYGAAQSLLTDLDARIGPEGISRIIGTAFAGTPIREAIEAEVGAPWP